MNTQIKIPTDAYDTLRGCVFAQSPKEAGCFALAGIRSTREGVTIFIRRAVPVPVEDFLVQEQYRLDVSSRAMAGLISLVEANELLPVVCHSHPEEIPYSMTDDYGEQRLAKSFSDFVSGDVVLVSLLFCPESIHGRVWLRGDPRPKPACRIDVVGQSLVRVLDDGERPVVETSLVARQILAFGEAGQAAVARTKVGIVGVGGSGSATVEQLARLGVQDFVLLDHDNLTESNVSRVYGSKPSALNDSGFGPPKVEIAERNIKAINPRARVVAVQKGVHEDGAADLLLDRDVLFMCTDEHRGRAAVNDLCYRYLIPAINMGVAIKSEEGRVSSAGGGVDIVYPDGPCLWCSQFLRASRIRAESMPEDERRRLELEGEQYVEGLDTAAPMVVSATSMVASQAVTEFLRMVTGFCSAEHAPQRLRWNMMDGTVGRGRTPITKECICRKYLGRGDM